MFGTVSILDELRREKRTADEKYLSEARQIIANENRAAQTILQNISEKPDSPASPLPFLENEENIFSIAEIRKIALRHRLRFLDAHLFKGEIPTEAVCRVRALEKKHSVKITSFKILAPRHLFRLEDRNKDPLLFASLGNEKYLLVHRWGNDLCPLRRFLFFPLQTRNTFIIAVLFFSLLIAIFTPASYPTRLFVFLLSNLALYALFACIGYLWLNHDFSEYEWNSRYVS